MTHAHGGDVAIGFAGETLDVKNYMKTSRSSAYVHLGSGTTFIRRLLSEDGRLHCHQTLLQSKIPKTTPYEVALRCEVGSNVPQIQFNDDGTWHDFAPAAKQGYKAPGFSPALAWNDSVSGLKPGGAGRIGLKPGAWYPYLMLNESARLSDHVMEDLKPESMDLPTSRPIPGAADTQKEVFRCQKIRESEREVSMALLKASHRPTPRSHGRVDWHAMNKPNHGILSNASSSSMRQVGTPSGRWR